MTLLNGNLIMKSLFLGCYSLIVKVVTSLHGKQDHQINKDYIIRMKEVFQTSKKGGEKC